ncbi:hypothetical protein Taro_030470 [Colocasia esculenta]|uniref:Uncharacterized protein n=1 Tax=Colocasia esculenta TaxID=4460 RepID=A0A843VGE8_COLES|nr:hypothetical protein [Colocasia esculenta]
MADSAPSRPTPLRVGRFCHPCPPEVPSLAAAAEAPRRLAAGAAACHRRRIWHIKNMKSKRWSRPLILVGLMALSLMHGKKSEMNEMKAYMKRKKTEKLLTTQQQQQLQDEISGRQIRRDYTLPINVDDDEDDDDPDPEFTAATSATRRSYAEEDERRRDLGTSVSHLSRDDYRRSLPRSTSVRRAASALGCGGYFFNPRIQYKDNVHNDGEVMRGTMNVITRLARTMNERLDAMAEVERYRMKLRIYGGYDMRCAAQRLTPVSEIDVDELLNEEHPLHAWVEMKAEEEIPELHPDDRLVLEPQEVMGLGVSFQDMRIIQYHPINKKEAKGKHKNNMGDMKANKGKQGMIGNMGLLIHPFLVSQNCHIQISALVVGLVTWAIFKLLGMVVSSLQDNQDKVQANK